MDTISNWFLSIGIHPLIGGAILGALLMLALRSKGHRIPTAPASRKAAAAKPSPSSSPHSSHTFRTLNVTNDGKKIQVPEEINEKLMEHLRNGEKIMAVKVLREATGLGLKESKDVVEAMERFLPR